MDIQIQNLWTDLHQELKIFIFSKVKDINISEDLLQDVFEKIHNNIHTLSDSSKLTSWVYQITRNIVSDYFRKMNLEIQIAGMDFPETESEEPLYQSLSNCINKKINNLPKKYKEAIQLTYFDQYSQIMLADQLQISYSGAKTRVQRGREKLKGLVLDCTNVETDMKENLISYNPTK